MSQNLRSYNRLKFGTAKPGYLSHNLTPNEIKKEKEIRVKQYHIDKLWAWYDRTGHKVMSEKDFLIWATEKILKKFGSR